MTDKPNRRSNSLTADLLADIESESVADLAEQLVAESAPPPVRPRTPVRRRPATATATPPAVAIPPAVATPAPGIEPLPVSSQSTDGPFVETTLFLSPSGWSRPAIRRDQLGVVLRAGPLRIRSGRR